MFDETRLTSIGIEFLAVVRRHWPELVEHARIDEFGSLTIEYPSPHTELAPILWISADVDHDEVIIAFGGGHSHGGPWQDPEDPDYQLLSSVEFVTAILEERIVGCTLRSGGAIGYLKHLQGESCWTEVVSVSSWRGTHDRHTPEEAG